MHSYPSSKRKPNFHHWIRNYIGRTNVSKPKANFDECEDFFVLVVECYVLVAALMKFGMKSLEETPSNDVVPANLWLCDKDERKKIISGLSETVVDSFIDFS